MELNKVYHTDCLKGLSEIDSNSIDLICIDPPYTDGKTDVLAGHKIQTKLDIQAITNEHFRVLKPNSFYACFGQMPTILAWYNAAIEAGFVFRQQIVWAKRSGFIHGDKHLAITDELIWIFKKGNPKYNKTDAN